MKTRPIYATNLLLVIFTFLLAGLTDKAVANSIPNGASDNSQATEKSVRDFLRPDGTIDFEAARSSGYQGALDVAGLSLKIDPRTGEPLAAVKLPGSEQGSPDDIYWNNSLSSQVPGADNWVRAAIMYDGKLVIGGDFSVAGTTVVNRIVAWDGARWSQLGSGFAGPYPVEVHCFAVFNGMLIAGGRFTTAGGVSANNIAAWNGSTWSPLGSGTSGSSSNGMVMALAVYDGQLVAGGRFDQAGGVTAKKLAVWDGSSWAEFHGGVTGGLSAEVHVLMSYNGTLYVGGVFTKAGPIFADNFASWGGTQWTNRSVGTFGTVSALTVYHNKVIVAGQFDWISDNIYALDPSTEIKTPLDPGPNYPIYSLTVFDNHLIAGGIFTTIGGLATNGVAAWNDSTWSLLSTGVGRTYALTVFSNAEYPTPQLIAAGDYEYAPGCGAKMIASWDGSQWSRLHTAPFGFATNNAVADLAVFQNKLIACGQFTVIGGVPANYIAAFDGSTWAPLGSGLNTFAFAMTVYQNKLIVGGLFTTAGGLPIQRIAAWDGSTWSALGSGSAISSEVYCLQTHDNKLFAGGEFGTAGGVNVQGIAAWDGVSWSRLGTEPGWIAMALAEFDNKLAVAWKPPVYRTQISFWDGVSWSGPSDSIYYVSDLEAYQDKLILSGYFDQVGTVEAHNIASWNGTNFEAVGSGFNGGIYSLLVHDGLLYIAGDFHSSTGFNSEGIAAWDGLSWTELGSGVSSSAEALVVYDNKLVVGGALVSAGGKTCPYLAEWTKLRDTDSDGISDGTDNCPLTANPSQADGNADGIGDVCQGRASITPVGNNVSVTPISGVALTFDEVGTRGVTEVKIDSIGIETPSGYSGIPQNHPKQYSVATNATFAGTAEVCIAYSVSQLQGSESEVAMLHSASGLQYWSDVTSSRDTVANRICGSVLSLSPFVLVEPVMCGDADGNGLISISDVVYLISYIFAGGPAPVPLASGDVDCNSLVNISDAVYLINYIFAGGAPPCAACK